MIYFFRIGSLSAGRSVFCCASVGCRIPLAVAAAAAALAAAAAAALVLNDA